MQIRETRQLIFLQRKCCICKIVVEEGEYIAMISLKYARRYCLECWQKRFDDGKI